MQERDLLPDRTPEEAGEELVTFAENAQLGSAEFQALSDYFTQQSLLGALDTQIKQAEHPGSNELMTPQRIQSVLRINEMKIALLENQIEQKKGSIPGYGRSFDFIEGVFDELGVDSIFNPSADQVGDEAELYEFPSDAYHKYHSKVEEIILEKRKAS